MDSNAYFDLAKLIIEECPEAAEKIKHTFELFEDNLTPKYYSAASEFVNLWNTANPDPAPEAEDYGYDDNEVYAKAKSHTI